MQFVSGFGAMTMRAYLLIFIALVQSANLIAEEMAPRQQMVLSVFDYPPFLMSDSDDFGIEPAVTKLAFEQMGVDVRFIFVPAARALELAKLGKVDGTLGWVHSAEREQDFYFSDTVASAPLVFFHLKEKPFTWNHYSDLQGKKIGTVNKYYYGEAFHEAQEKMLFEIESVSEDILNLKKLVAGRIDLTPINLYVGYYLARQLFDAKTFDAITHNSQQLKLSSHHLLLPKVLSDSSSRLSLFNQGLHLIQQSGEYQRILDRYSPESQIVQ